MKAANKSTAENTRDKNIIGKNSIGKNTPDENTAVKNTPDKNVLVIDLELERVISEIKRAKARKVCIQLPDGLKPKAEMIQERILKDTSADVVIWAGSCFGACDLPSGLERLGVDMLVQWGHSEFS
ncbi:diphthamide synthesis protein [Candidatus Woesearchaeota archaeon]|nr:diphthamide synthesis protein [Candidatus Woesearchaeota archaeon]